MTDEAALAQAFTKLRFALKGGRLVPFLGAGASLCGRPPLEPAPVGGAAPAWQPGSGWLPTGAELARHLLDELEISASSSEGNLIRVAQYFMLKYGEQPLYSQLHEVFKRDYQPTRLHRLLAHLPAVLEALGAEVRFPLIVTTNYDTLIERAYAERGIACDVLHYCAKPNDKNHGRLIHTPPDGEPVPVIDANNYTAVNPKQRSVILKIHGAVWPQGAAEHSDFVITEDDYIDYLTRISPENLIPTKVLGHLRAGTLLFLGYSLADWNLRALLTHIWHSRKLSVRSLAVQRPLQASPERPADLLESVDLESWAARQIDPLVIDITEFTERFERHLRERYPAAFAVGGDSPV